MSSTESMEQKTIGNITHNGVTYDIDWMFREENGIVAECEDIAIVFVGDDQVSEFCNPDWEMSGWLTVEDCLSDAEDFIRQTMN